MLKVLIVDDHAVTRMAISMLLARAGHKNIGECSNGIEAVTKTAECKPDAIILDLDMPLLGGMAVIEKLRNDSVSTGIIVHTGMNNKSYAIQCMLAGAAAYLPKTGNPQEILIALKAVSCGETYFPIEKMASVRRTEFLHCENQIAKKLTRRELSVLVGLAAGKTNLVIAKELMLSNKTISNYKIQLMHKLGTRNLVEAIEFARRIKLV